MKHRFLYVLKKVWHYVWRVILSIVVFLCGALVVFYFAYTPSQTMLWGASFVPKHAESLGLNPREAFLAVVNDLGVKYIRLAAYWEDIEAEQGNFLFTETDWYLQAAEQNQVKVILTVGHKQPRWPECHHPGWYDELSSEDKETALKNFVTQSVNHFKVFKSVEVWQVENEPYFKFGPECNKTTSKLLTEEVSLVKSLDNRPVLVTDSGELGRWVFVNMVGADYFGTTMYRTVHTPTYGYFTYPLPPGFFKIKAGVLQVFFKPQKIWGVELQAEPWFEAGVLETPLERHFELMNPEQFIKNMQYAEEVGFERNYLWGVEWMYWLKVKQQRSEMWETAKRFYQSKK